MIKIFPSQYFFDRDIESKYIEWLFEKTRVFVMAVGILLVLCITSMNVADVYSKGFDTLLSSVFPIRIGILAITVAMTLAFLFLPARVAYFTLFMSNIILAISASVDTYFWVIEVEYFTPASQMISIFFFMIVPFLNVEHKALTGMILILGMVACGQVIGADYYFTLFYVLIIYSTLLVVYYKFDVLLRLQFKSLCEEKKNSNIDQLTKVYNRKALHSLFEEDLMKVEEKCKMVVGILDIDCFKLYNDTYGHLAGDKVLKQVAQTLQSFGFDRVYRFGGEEFIFTMIIDGWGDDRLPDICSNLENHMIKHRTSTVSSYVTVSVGMVNVKHEKLVRYGINKSLADKIIKNADDNLYKAKESGRNKSVVTEFGRYELLSV